jgi:hypothetical protein
MLNATSSIIFGGWQDAFDRKSPLQRSSHQRASDQNPFIGLHKEPEYIQDGHRNFSDFHHQNTRSVKLFTYIICTK